MKWEGKFKSKFVLLLALITILGLLVSALIDFDVFDLTPYSSGIISIILGFGLMLEGNIRTMLGFFRKGTKIELPEVVHIFAAIIGLIVFVVGVLAVVGIAIPTAALGITGTVKSIAIFVVIAEYFV